MKNGVCFVIALLVFQVFQDFDLGNLEDFWCHNVDTKWCKIPEVEYLWRLFLYTTETLYSC